MAVLSFVLELLLELFSWVPCDWVSRRRDRDDGPSYFLWFLVGLVLGGISVVLFHGALIHAPVLRIVNLILAPVLAGFMASRIKGRADRAGDVWLPPQRFWCAFWLTLGVVLVRFAVAGR